MRPAFAESSSADAANSSADFCALVEVLSPSAKSAIERAAALGRRRLDTSIVAFDVLWSLSPFLLLHHINFGLALACTTLLVYSPFAQRSLMLMGAGETERKAAVAVHGAVGRRGSGIS